LRVLLRNGTFAARPELPVLEVDMVPTILKIRAVIDLCAVFVGGVWFHYVYIGRGSGEH